MDKSLYEYDPTKAERKALGYDLEEKAKRHLALDKINRELKIGTVVFYISGAIGQRKVEFGTIDYHYPGVVSLALYDHPRRRAIDGVSIDQMHFPTPFKKLPKKWTYNTELYKVTYLPIPPEVAEEAKHLSYRKPEDIRRAIDIGFFVNRRDVDYSSIETNIENGNGWQIVKRSKPYEEPLRNISKATFEIYQTYEEAEEVIAVENRQLQIESEMSDEEWSIYQIDRTLARVAGLTETEREQHRNFLLSLDKIEDVVVRVNCGVIQWKYENNKRWNNIEV